MKYSKYVKTIKGCPFCESSKPDIILENKYAYVKLSIAPKEKDHVLVVPKRHVTRLSQMGLFERVAFKRLLWKTYLIFSKHYSDISILYREGNKKVVGKSVRHLHVHIVPKGLFHSRIDERDVEILTDEELRKGAEKIKRLFDKY